MGNRQPNSVQLGEHIYDVVPQKLGRLKRQLGATLDTLGDQTVSQENLLGMIGDQAYTLLGVFIPDLMPKWEWDGYGSPTAATDDAYDEAGDRSPDADQVVTAFRVCMSVNKLDLFRHLGSVVDPSMLRGVVTDALSRTVNSSLDSTSSGTAGMTSATKAPTSGNGSVIDGTATPVPEPASVA